ncbi:hypothetical protein G7K_3526-t1 [Saitoella complicata NRRL Y-17804]|uniref:Uncharacterized protein n=1 Tax=Saitoella complicata (strain BCRC 22490 / CBS 7301 / JCM 7358 / NBRC 10748 / NRRL Y-17804) TaxID=698492 RepID=A0A0E9NJ12_SAICN|nr:hypothetical protein G7K_3526-t1 [Saitoella complicata NRRL Y-17804]
MTGRGRPRFDACLPSSSLLVAAAVRQCPWMTVQASFQPVLELPRSLHSSKEVVVLFHLLFQQPNHPWSHQWGSVLRRQVTERDVR